MSSDDVMVDPVVLREQVQKKYREVAEAPQAVFHFHTGLLMAEAGSQFAHVSYDGRRPQCCEQSGTV